MKNREIRNQVRQILVATHGPVLSSALKTIREIKEKQKNTLTLILNSLEFKNDVISAGGEIYAVGGIVRDAIMGKPSDDLDIVIRGIPYENLFKILSKYGKPTDTSFEDEEGKKEFGATKFVSASEKFNKLLSDNGIRKDIDVMLPRKDRKEEGGKGHRSIKSDVNHNFTIYDDLKRRDITINAIALDLKGNVIDNGFALNDIKNGVIRAVSEDSFIEDPLRMLRAIRFAARFNYKWDNTTLDLIRKNAHLLSDKTELPRERFLGEFEKMIGKSDLGRAVKLLVELGLYKAIFGIEPNFNDFNKFDKTTSVGEFSYMLFETEPSKNILPLITKNITNTVSDLKYVEALIKYVNQIKDKNLDLITKINALSGIYNLSSDMLLNSSYIDGSDKEISRKFESGILPKSANDINFKGDDFKRFVIDSIEATGRNFNEKMDMAKMGKAKQVSIQAIYNNIIPNEKEAIKNYLIKNIELWLN